MIWEKAKSSHENWKQKEGEGSKAGEFFASKGWSDNFRERFGLKIFSEVKTFLASKGLPFQVLLILNNAPGHTELHELSLEDRLI